MPYSTYHTEGKKPLEKHQDCLKEIYTLTTAEEFDAYPTRMKEYDLSESNIKTLEWVLAHQRRIRVQTILRSDELSTEYKEIDKEQFTDTDLIESGIVVEVVGGDEPTLTTTDEKPKRTRSKSPTTPIKSIIFGWPSVYNFFYLRNGLSNWAILQHLIYLRLSHELSISKENGIEFIVFGECFLPSVRLNFKSEFIVRILYPIYRQIDTTF